MNDNDSDLINSYTFSINVKGYNGIFTVHRPTIGEVSKMEILESRELGGMKNISTIGAARMISVLDVVVDNAPEWWKPRELEDLEVVQVVYDKYIDYLREFPRQAKFERESGRNFYQCRLLV